MSRKTNRNALLAFALVVALPLAVSFSAEAATIPQRVSVQGILKNASGQLVDATVPIEFLFYDASTAGTVLWQDTLSVNVNKGRYGVILGSTANPITVTVFQTLTWLAMNVNADGEMTPRVKVTTAPYAFAAEQANSANTALTATDADTVDGKHASDFDMPPVALLTVSQVWTFTGVDATFDASASYDPEGGALEFAWDVLGDGGFTVYGAGNTTTQSYSRGFSDNLAVVRVRDQTGRVAESKALVRSQAEMGPIWAAAAQTVDSGGGDYTSLAVVDGRPAISYYETTNRDLKFAINAAVDGSGVWTTYTVDSAGNVGHYTSLAVVDGRPAISYYDLTNADLKFAINVAVDGSGVWTTYAVDSAGNVGEHCSLAVVDGRPAISYYDLTNADLKFAINAAVDGSGAWSTYTVDSLGTVGQFCSLAVVDGRPAISYSHYNGIPIDVSFAINAVVDGSGPWSTYVVADTGNSVPNTSLAVVDGKPAISYQGPASDLWFAINPTVDGSGAWTTRMVASGGLDPSLAVVDGKPAISYDVSTNLKYAINATVDGSGGWNLSTLDSEGAVGTYSSLAVVNGKPAISYSSDQGLKFLISP